MASIFMEGNGSWFNRVPERRPAASRFKLGVTSKQRSIAPGAVKDPVSLLGEKLAAPRGLGGGLAKNGIALRRELGTPLGVVFGDGIRHGILLRSVS